MIIYPSSGTGAWEAALVNMLSPGDHLLMYETGHFATLWQKMAQRLGLRARVPGAGGHDETGLPRSWRHGVQADLIEERLQRGQRASHQGGVRGAQRNLHRRHLRHRRRAPRDRCGEHPALLMVDSISGLASADYRHDEWGVDVTVSGSQKGLMLPPGLGFNALSPKAIEAAKTAQAAQVLLGLGRDRRDEQGRLLALHAQHQPSLRPAEALDMLLDRRAWTSVFARHQRWGGACAARCDAWGLPIAMRRRALHSPILTGVIMPQGVDADALRKLILERFDLSLGAGLGKLKGRMFRIGHLGNSNDLTLMAALAGCEMGLKLAGVPLAGSGVLAAMAFFAA